jgi:phosphoglycolate phosphatase-like HAD superfamily hydrolase
VTPADADGRVEDEVDRWQVVRCVAFDFDGTLVDSNAIKRGAYFEVLSQVPGSAEVLERVLRDHPGADRFGILGAAHGALAQRPGLPALARLVSDYSSLCEERVSRCPALPGAVAALEALAGSHALYVDSATPADALERIVALRGWTGFFRGVLGGPRSKLENLVELARREHLAPEQVLYVGDAPQDREAAAAFGCRFLGRGAPRRDLRASASLSALAPLVDEIAARSPRDAPDQGWSAPAETPSRATTTSGPPPKRGMR